MVSIKRGLCIGIILICFNNVEFGRSVRNFETGCDCKDSTFGCCSDDYTPASGPNMTGCETAMLNLQVSCSLPKDRGTCKNYTPTWFYDHEYGGCSRFWYGGCGGNSNRFENKEDCEAVCVNPEGIDRCKLPKATGPCEQHIPKWYYDEETNHCAQFDYGGCLGNNNKFETRRECKKLCVKNAAPSLPYLDCSRGSMNSMDHYFQKMCENLKTYKCRKRSLRKKNMLTNRGLI